MKLTSRPVRVLFYDINIAFINPTSNLVRHALAEQMDVVFFGPGYVDGDILRRGLDQFVTDHGPFDIAVTTDRLIMRNEMDDVPPPDSGVYRAYSWDFPKADFKTVGRNRLSFAALPCPRVVVLMESDFYNWTSYHTDRIEETAEYMLCVGNEFLLNPEAMAREIHSEFFAAHYRPEGFDFLRRNAHRISSTPHFVGETEFCFTPLSHRPRSWSVEGAKYAARQHAYKLLTGAGYKIDKRPPSVYYERILRLRKRKPTRIEQLVTNHLFNRRFERAQLSYTCGSALRFPLRKFFEIPARGSVLVCQPFQGFSEAGFVDGVSAVVSEPADILTTSQTLQSNLHQAQTIADAGRRLVWEKHSLHARAAQFSASFLAMVEGRFSGAAWSKGEFFLQGQTS